MKIAIAFATILLLASPAAADWPWHWRRSKSAAQSQTASLAPTTDSNPSSAPGPGYTIGLGDVLRISVWKEPDITETVQVRSDGKISVPLLNDVPAVSLTPMELATSLAGSLKKYVDDPRVTVIVTQIKAPTIYMVGEVGRRGPMALTTDMTVLQALVTSGLTLFANAKKIYVLRMVNGVQEKFRVNYKRLLKGKSLNQNIILKPGDMVVVP